MQISKGDIFLIELGGEGAVGSEQMGTRPCVVVSNNTGNKFSPCVTVAFVTSQQNKANLPTHVPLAQNAFGLTKQSIILCEQLRTVDKTRLTKYIGTCSVPVLAQIEYALRVALGL